MRTLRIALWAIVLVAGATMFLASAPVAADICQADDLIVDGSVNIGIDSVCNRSFGFDTLILSENNLRVFFEDTSSSASFPSNDWRIVINDSSNGGGQYFAVEDSSAGRQPFRIEAGARSNALYVEGDGDVGVGTSNPVVEMHLVRGDTPTLRLEQDGSSGFTPQTWDMAGNETNFFIRDVTNGSRLPFRIRPSAPTNSIYVDSNGEVGFGTASPSANLHIVGSNGGDPDIRIVGDSTVLLRLERDVADVVGFQMANTAQSWNNTVLAGGNYAISDVGDGAELTLTPAGNMTLTGTLTITGGCSGCDAVFTDAFPLESIEDHAAEMWENGYLPAVGETREGQVSIDVFQKTTGILQELEKAHIYIDQLNDDVKARDAAISELSVRLARLEASAIE